jgi:hypothetical protein
MLAFFAFTTIDAGGYFILVQINLFTRVPFCFGAFQYLINQDVSIASFARTSDQRQYFHSEPPFSFLVYQLPLYPGGKGYSFIPINHIGQSSPIAGRVFFAISKYAIPD